MSFENFHAVLALLMSEGPQPVHCFDPDMEPEEIFRLLQSREGRSALSSRLGCRVGEIDWKKFDGRLDALERCAAGAICCLDTSYPESFREVAAPPPLLFYRGSVELLRRRGIAVVGTRKPSPGGMALARNLGRSLGAHGIAVVSGLARGIDTGAHVGALRGGSGTVAVIGTGIDVPYPPENAELMADVARDGCVVTEQWMGMHADRHVFPKRNRLISALSHAVVVVEGGLRSGALITARWALEQGRDVGAVPGFPGDFRSAGPNQLLRHGAFVVETVADILEAVPLLRRSEMKCVGEDTGQSDNPGGNAGTVLHALGGASCHPDEIARTTGLPIAEVVAAVVQLEMDGHIERDDAGGVTRLRK